MKEKIFIHSGGRVGRSPYRDHHVADKHNVSCKRVGLDTPLKEHSGLLDQRGAL
jgi:hypothetical protein